MTVNGNSGGTPTRKPPFDRWENEKAHDGGASAVMRFFVPLLGVLSQDVGYIVNR